MTTASSTTAHSKSAPFAIPWCETSSRRNSWAVRNAVDVVYLTLRPEALRRRGQRPPMGPVRTRSPDAHGERTFVRDDRLYQP